MREELDGPENKAYRALLAAKTPEEAAHAWDAHYERSDGSTRDSACSPHARSWINSAKATADLEFSCPPTPQQKERACPRLAQTVLWAPASSTWAQVPKEQVVRGSRRPEDRAGLLTNGAQFVTQNMFTPKPDDDAYTEELKKKSAAADLDRFNELQGGAAKLDEGLARAKALRKALDNPDIVFGGAGNLDGNREEHRIQLGIDTKGLDRHAGRSAHGHRVPARQRQEAPGLRLQLRRQAHGSCERPRPRQEPRSNLQAVDARLKAFDIRRRSQKKRASTPHSTTVFSTTAGFDSTLRSGRRPQHTAVSAPEAEHVQTTPNGRNWSY
jgi:hypothetical protein